MKSKKLICLAVAAALTMGVSLTGCLVTNSEENLKQTVATVNITKNENFAKNFGGYESAITDKTFNNRDLMMAYFTVYYQYADQLQGSLFPSITNSLVSDAVLTQYATVSLLKEKVEAGELSLDAFKAKETEAEKLEYILGGDKPEEAEGVRQAKYTVKRVINNTLDSLEKSRIKQEQGYEGSGTRATPSGIDTLVEDYLPETYSVYTGYEGYLKPGEDDEYEPLDGTTRSTRVKAYDDFIASLSRYYLLSDADAETTDVMQLSYTKDAYVIQLQSQVINAFYESYTDKQEKLITETTGEGDAAVYGYIQDKYNSTLKTQTGNYDSATSFETAMGSMSDTSFILYSPDTRNDTEDINGYGTFGYVYNILLPFSASQNIELKSLQNYRDNSNAKNAESIYLRDRNAILKNIETTDQREAWFNGDTDYSFNAGESGLEKYYGKEEGRDYLFFENNVTKSGENGKYEKLNKYLGLYSYNGQVKENVKKDDKGKEVKTGSYSLVPNKLTIDGMLSEFKSYINFVLDADAVKIYEGDEMTHPYTKEYEGYYDVADFTAKDSEKEIDYSKLVYVTGKVELDEDDLKKENMFVESSKRYRVMSAVNELQYAYTTDTGVLSQYIGYSVSAYETSYIKEFEYAAQQALKMGVGAFKVCAGDYGWHLIYVTDAFSFKGGNVYEPVFSKTRVETEGTFENSFYNWVKDSVLSDEENKMRSEILKKFNNDDAVTINEKAYKDLA